MPSFKNSLEFTSFSLTALKIDLTKNGSFFYPHLVWDLWLLGDRWNKHICFVRMHELACMRWNCVEIQQFIKLVLCCTRPAHVPPPPLPQKRDFIVTSAFVSGKNLNVGLNLTLSHFLKIYFSESLSLKLAGRGRKPTKNQTRIWCVLEVIWGFHILLPLSPKLVSDLLISFPTCSW